jgi:hypothetical protein
VTTSFNITIWITSHNAGCHIIMEHVFTIVSRPMTAGDLHKPSFHYGPMKMVLHLEQLLYHVATDATLLVIQPHVALWRIRHQVFWPITQVMSLPVHHVVSVRHLHKARHFPADPPLQTQRVTLCHGLHHAILSCPKLLVKIHHLAKPLQPLFHQMRKQIISQDPPRCHHRCL